MLRKVIPLSHYSIVSLMYNVDLALQGAARMALQHGAHPAQIKDTVTSVLLPFLGNSYLITFMQLLVDAPSLGYLL